MTGKRGGGRRRDTQLRCWGNPQIPQSETLFDVTTGMVPTLPVVKTKMNVMRHTVKFGEFFCLLSLSFVIHLAWRIWEYASGYVACSTGSRPVLILSSSLWLFFGIVTLTLRFRVSGFVILTFFILTLSCEGLVVALIVSLWGVNTHTHTNTHTHIHTHTHTYTHTHMHTHYCNDYDSVQNSTSFLKRRALFL